MANITGRRPRYVMVSPSSSSSSSPPSSRRRRRRRQEQEDRIGALPEPVLLHILSFLPTLYAVRTSVLSTRWRTLWTSVGVLDLDECCEFFSYGTGKQNFSKFVGKVLSYHQTLTLHKLRLRCCFRYFLHLKDRVIRTAVSSGVHTLDLRLPVRYPNTPEGRAGRLPSLLLTSPSLVDLRLDLGVSTLILSGTPALIGLRRMRLRCAKFYDDHSTRALFSSSTSLRSLVLDTCYYRKLDCLEISCSSLQELVIEYRTNSDYAFDGLHRCQVKIVAPQLSSFVYRLSVAQSYVVESLSCVEHVKIEFLNVIWREEDNLPVLNRASSFISSLSSARNLDICPICVEALQLRAIPFRNLNVLTTGVYKHDPYRSFRVILRLLVSNPRLRALIVHVRDLHMRPLSAGKKDFSNYLRTCFKHGYCGAVERVEIRCSDYSLSPEVISNITATVLELVKALLGSQANLNKLILSNRLFCDSRREALMKKVRSFPIRAARAPEISFI